MFPYFFKADIKETFCETDNMSQNLLKYFEYSDT